MYSSPDDAALPAPGFPIRKSAGQRLFSASPRLIAAVHVLHRLLVPRHPPCALTILTVSFAPHPRVSSDANYPMWAPRERGARIGLCAVFKLRRGGARGYPARGLWKLSSAPRALGTRRRSGRRFGTPRCTEVLQDGLPRSG